jgi:hypothetical protein
VMSAMAHSRLEGLVHLSAANTCEHRVRHAGQKVQCRLGAVPGELHFYSGGEVLRASAAPAAAFSIAPGLARPIVGTADSAAHVRPLSGIMPTYLALATSDEGDGVKLDREPLSTPAETSGGSSERGVARMCIALAPASPTPATQFAI